MKKTILIFFAIISMLMTGCQKSSDSASSLPSKGSIYGIITDFQTGEPVRNANVQLRPSGETTLTGSNGMYEFADINDGDYSITVSKAEYTDLIDDYVISVRDGRRMKRDVQIQKQSAVLSIVDNNQAPLHELDFGSAGVSQKTFNIFNSGTVNLRFEITKTANWITDINPSNETVNMGSTRAISVTINRSLLSIGENITTIVISTNSGGVELTIKARKDGGGINDVVELTEDGLMVQKADFGCYDWYSAKSYCQSSHVANYNDWRLPTIDEFKILYNYREYIEGFENDYYWSSTSHNSWGNYYYCYNMSHGWNDEDPPSKTHYVRAVRDINDVVVIPGTNLMVQKTDLGCYNWNDAQAVCQSSHIANYNDWRLPTIDELRIFYDNKEYIGAYVNDKYWSSVNCNWSDDYFYYFDFLQHTSSYSIANNIYYVRAVRDVSGGGGGSGAQTTWSDNFENNSLYNWTNIDADGDGVKWLIINPLSEGIGDAHSGLYCASSWSWSNTAYDPDNYMISPLCQNATSIQYYVATNTGYPDHYAVMASSTGTNINNFTIVFEETAPVSKHNCSYAKATLTSNNDTRGMSPWTQRNINLPAGTKYVAFRHFNSYDMNYILIDDVTITMGQ